MQCFNNVLTQAWLNFLYILQWKQLCWTWPFIPV